MRRDERWSPTAAVRRPTSRRCLTYRTGAGVCATPASGCGLLRSAAAVAAPGQYACSRPVGVDCPRPTRHYVHLGAVICRETSVAIRRSGLRPVARGALLGAPQRRSSPWFAWSSVASVAIIPTVSRHSSPVVLFCCLAPTSLSHLFLTTGPA